MAPLQPRRTDEDRAVGPASPGHGRIGLRDCSASGGSGPTHRPSSLADPSCTAGSALEEEFGAGRAGRAGGEDGRPHGSSPDRAEMTWLSPSSVSATSARSVRFSAATATPAHSTTMAITATVPRTASQTGTPDAAVLTGTDSVVNERPPKDDEGPRRLSGGLWQRIREKAPTPRIRGKESPTSSSGARGARWSRTVAPHRRESTGLLGKPVGLSGMERGSGSRQQPRVRPHRHEPWASSTSLCT
jgi:hypothetical protein